MLLKLHVTVCISVFCFLQNISMSSSFLIPSPAISIKHNIGMRISNTNIIYNVVNMNINVKHSLTPLGSSKDSNNGSSNDRNNSDGSIDSRRTRTKSTKSNGKKPSKPHKNPKQKVWNTSIFPVKDFKLVQVQPLSTTLSSSSNILQKEFYTLTTAGMIGIFGGTSVAFFKLSVDAIRQFFYGGGLTTNFFAATATGDNTNGVVPFFAIPVLGAIGVALLNLSGEFSPGLKGVVSEVDENSLTFGDFQDEGIGTGMSDLDAYTDAYSYSYSPKGPLRSIRKALAATVTLGTGNSLGPEGPGVEIGVAISRFWMYVWDSLFAASATAPASTSKPIASSTTNNVTVDEIVDRITRNRLLLACGAAAGVSSGFNAPLSGVFFALEVVQASLPTLSIQVPSPPPGTGTATEGISSIGKIELQQQSLSASSGSITAILISSVLAALVSRLFLGDELALKLLTYDIQTPLSELPLYILLGTFCGVVSVAFSQTAKFSKAVFEGNAGPEFIQDSFGALPAPLLPILGGLTCGGVGYFYPQVLFFGYETLNGLLENDNLPTEMLLTLLLAKTFTTAVSAGSGLVGGVFAPSLFLGGMTGAAFHNIVCDTFRVFSLDETVTTTAGGVLFDLAGVPIYSSVGAASVLAALFRAPLTASLLLFEITRNYDVLLPLLASAGIATLASDILEGEIESIKQRDDDNNI